VMVVWTVVIVAAVVVTSLVVASRRAMSETGREVTVVVIGITGDVVVGALEFVVFYTKTRTTSTLSH
jgi:hypothetical protein